MEDGIDDMQNRFSFNQQLSDPNLGHRDSLIGRIAQQNSILGNNADGGDMRMTRKRTSMVNYEQFPGADQPGSLTRLQSRANQNSIFNNYYSNCSVVYGN